jgi:hypothetical protein
MASVCTAEETHAAARSHLKEVAQPLDDQKIQLDSVAPHYNDYNQVIISQGYESFSVSSVLLLPSRVCALFLFARPYPLELSRSRAHRLISLPR